MSYAMNKAKLRAQRKRRRPKRVEVQRVLERVGAIERIADRLDKNDQSRAELLQVGREFLGDLGPVPVSVAAALLQVSEPTVRAWSRRGILSTAADRGSGLDAQRLHEVVVLVRDLRAAGHDRDLLNKVWSRLTDSALLERDDLQESLGQMRRGEGTDTDLDELEKELGIAD
ncbi:hypothetical protein Adi01nite_26900 [Amorphoplanes digitatis]|uniref:Uncharacterized protein n=1 Tax=Actinoplanes digitatis TaxID=1868 RepID=A0A7W7I3V5_9ACTN|nr:hypothetical protein [Actinoplanes digitatis]MBB4765928.1 hypothetical protein [Actinoplanes digitatis]GID93278.1 hypothetical protein Adi01nite_26900 [Actinoplanes digitatis]